jgi:hypothetical protein
MTSTEWAIVSEMVLATGLNTVATIEDKHDPLPTMIASGALGLTLLLVSDFNAPLAKAFAATFLGGTLVLRYKVWGPILDYLGGNADKKG